MDDQDEPTPSMPAIVQKDFVRTTTLRTMGGWRRPLASSASEAEKKADGIEATRKARIQSARLRAWLTAATAAHRIRPDDFDARAVTADSWSRFVHWIEISHRGRTVLKVPNLHGWPLPGPAEFDGIGSEAVGPILKTLSDIEREPSGTTFEKDAEKAGALWGALLRTTRRDVHDLLCDAEDRCWLIVEIEQENGLATCVIDPSESVEGGEAYAWHPPATASDAVPLRLQCERQGGVWSIDSRRWKGVLAGTRPPVTAIRPPIMDPMETLRLCAPHAE